MPRQSREEIRKYNEDKILSAAEKAFAEHGYRGASLSMIAAMADIPKSNITYYFESKESLYKLVLSNICHLWLQAGDEITVENDPYSALSSYINDKMEISRSKPYASKVWANEVINGARFLEGYISTTVKEWILKRSKVMEFWMERGQVCQTDPQTIFYMIWSITQHYADFSSQIEILNAQQPLTDEQWTLAKATVISMVTSGLGIQRIIEE